MEAQGCLHILRNRKDRPFLKKIQVGAVFSRMKAIKITVCTGACLLKAAP